MTRVNNDETDSYYNTCSKILNPFLPAFSKENICFQVLNLQNACQTLDQTATTEAVWLDYCLDYILTSENEVFQILEHIP